MKKTLLKVWPWFAAFLPTLVAVALVAILVEFDVMEFHFSIQHVDTLLIFTGLLLTVISTSILISREAIRRMQRFDMEHARNEANAEHARFLRRLDHELKNPLMGIKMAVENLAETQDSETRRRISSEITTEVTRIGQLALGLRKLAEVGTQPLEVRSIDLNNLLHEVFLAAKEHPGADERILSLEQPEIPLTLMGDHDLLLLSVYNLLSNAIKFTKPGDLIVLRAGIQEETVLIEVEDQGVGIADTDIHHIWDELYRAERAKSIPGSGIGLALVKLIIERHGGNLEVQSQLNQGTTIRICLPTAPAANVVPRLMRPVSSS